MPQSSALVLVIPDRAVQQRLADEANQFVNPPRLVEASKAYPAKLPRSTILAVPADLGDYPVEDRWGRVTYGPDG